MADEPNRQVSEFQAEAGGRRTTLPGELWAFLKHNKKWWLTPIILILLLLGLGIVTMGGVAPFIYALF